MNHSRRENSETHRVGDGIGDAQEHGRVSLVLGLVKGAVGNNLRNIIGHASVVEGIEDRDGHKLGVQNVLN